MTSNVLINITTDVTFASLIKLSGLKNISIIEHDNPTVNCTDAAGIHLTSCHNFTIQGITWDGCGTKSEPGIKLTDSDDITIKYCSFQSSMGQAIALVGVLGDVSISHCNFMYNNYHRGHGTAIHYLSGIVANTCRLLFTITNCSFIYNKGAKSLVYIENNAGRNDDISFQFSQFHHNQGVSIYVVNQKLYLHRTILFWNNTAEDGAGIYVSNHSTVIFGRNSTVAFVKNSANYRGGAIFLINNCSIVFDQNSTAIMLLEDMAEQYTLAGVLTYFLMEFLLQCLITILPALVEELSIPMIIAQYILRTPLQCLLIILLSMVEL